MLKHHVLLMYMKGMSLQKTGLRMVEMLFRVSPVKEDDNIINNKHLKGAYYG